MRHWRLTAVERVEVAGNARLPTACPAAECPISPVLDAKDPKHDGSSTRNTQIGRGAGGRSVACP